MTEPVAGTMRGQCQPQSGWRDDIAALTQNEVAINGNAPFIWVTTFLSPT